MPKAKKQVRPTKKTLGITFRGVSPQVWKKNNGFSYSFRSRIGHMGTQYHLGCFTTPEQAALAYNRKAKSIFRSEKNAKKRNMWNQM
jgi:hypothetical protein